MRNWRTRLPGVHIETTSFYDTERDQFETGDPPERSKLIYAEHMNVLAKSGLVEDGTPKNPVPQGHLNPVHLTAVRRFGDPVTDAEIEAAATPVRVSFDELYRSTLRELRQMRRSS